MSTAQQRVDARNKVTGTLRYGADRAPDGLAYAAFAVATAGRGRVISVDTDAAQKVPGVHLVITRIDPEELGSPGFIMGGGYGFQSFQPLTGNHVAYRGQPIALVVADTLLAATEAAELVTATYKPEPFAVTLDAPAADTIVQSQAIPLPMLANTVTGDADAAFAAAPVQIDAEFHGPAQHQVPMELISSVAEWRGDTLVVHEGTQNSGAIQNGLAVQLGIDPGHVEVISPSVGGGFGQKNSLQPHIGPLAIAARRLGRPVKLVLTRPQTFHQSSFRPVSRQRVRLGADATGAAAGGDPRDRPANLPPRPVPRPVYRGVLPAVRDRQLPRPAAAGADRRANPWLHARAVRAHLRLRHRVRSRRDRLCHRAGPRRGPAGQRRRRDPVTGLPFSSRHVAECLRRGAERFGWADRNPEPRSMRDGDGTLIGWGVAIGAYPGNTAPAIAKLSADTAGTIRVAVAGHEMGQGIRTAITLLVADDLGIQPTAVQVSVGDTRRAPQHLTAGSSGYRHRAARRARRPARTSHPARPPADRPGGPARRGRRHRRPPRRC